jgi:predicted nuclease of restriction endonuclease-like (RecB) superfamily
VKPFPKSPAAGKILCYCYPDTTGSSERHSTRQNAIQKVNTELINLYWLVGEHISKRLASSHWGEKTIDELAQYLNTQHPERKGFNRRGRYRMRQFYETYSSAKIVSSLRTQLGEGGIKRTLLAQVSWTHHLVLLGRAKTEQEREFYLRLSVPEKYRVRELERTVVSSSG